MAVKYGSHEKPSKIKVDSKQLTPTFGRFIAEPLERGFGHTLGNSLRRVMLFALEAPAIISVHIEGVAHEFAAIEGVIEDMTNIILNFKSALFRKLPTEKDGAHDYRILSADLDISKKDIEKGNGQYFVTLGEFFKDGSFEVVNPELVLFTVTKPLKKHIDLKVMIGRGYVPSERHHIPERDIDEIIIDSAFSPVRLVNYYVENTRVGQDTDYDRLVLEITTDGRLTPAEALSFAAQIAAHHYEEFKHVHSDALLFNDGGDGRDGSFDEILEKLLLRIDEIELSVRSANCLQSANIDTIAELVSIPERRLLEFRNFGKKSLTEIKEVLTMMELHLGMDLTKYGIKGDVKEQVKKLREERSAS